MRGREGEREGGREGGRKWKYNVGGRKAKWTWCATG